MRLSSLIADRIYGLRMCSEKMAFACLRVFLGDWGKRERERERSFGMILSLGLAYELPIDKRL